MTKKRFRKKQAGHGKDGFGGRSYWMYGIHACSAALDNPQREILRIIANVQIAPEIELEPHHPFLEVLDNTAIQGLLPRDAVHQGIALEVRPLEPMDLEEALDEDKPLVVLDQVTDPHNVGAILRSAAAFDAAAVVVTKNHAPKENGAMAKSASGALDIVPLVCVTNLASSLEIMKEAGYWVWGMDGSAQQTLREAKPSRKTALVMGAEGDGMRRLTAEHCDVMVRLPIDTRMESLNVSNAAAIALYELSLV